MILAGDIGGTSTRLGIFESNQSALRLVASDTLPSRSFESLDEIILQFTAIQGVKVRHACFGIAGPVINEKVQTPNLPWMVEARTLAQKLSLARVSLINDLEANAYGIAILEPGEMVTLNVGDHQVTGNAAVISAGTGLGEAGLYWDGNEHRPFGCEGGHADFAPGNDLEVELLQYLRPRFGHVSWERVLSGPGLCNLHRFLCTTGRGEESSAVAEVMRQEYSASVITTAALEERCQRCSLALDLFVSIYGAAAGNLALKLMAHSGVYLGGGIAPKIIRKLSGPGFMRAFTDKGRMHSLLEKIPVRVLMNDKAALWGAARYANRAA